MDLNTAKDLAFHFNPRFNEDGKRVIVRNSCIQQKWGKEERELQNFPFVLGQPFEVSVKTEKFCSRKHWICEFYCYLMFTVMTPYLLVIEPGEP